MHTESPLHLFAIDGLTSCNKISFVNALLHKLHHSDGFPVISDIRKNDFVFQLIFPTTRENIELIDRGLVKNYGSVTLPHQIGSDDLYPYKIDLRDTGFDPNAVFAFTSDHCRLRRIANQHLINSHAMHVVAGDQEIEELHNALQNQFPADPKAHVKGVIITDLKGSPAFPKTPIQQKNTYLRSSYTQSLGS